MPTGWRRLLPGYTASAVAAVLGLPGLAAGMITANTCLLRQFDCPGRSTYGVLGATVLALIIQLVLATQFRLGWPFSAVSTLLAEAAMIGIGPIWVLIIALALCPAVAAWVTDPPAGRRTMRRHWVPRWAVLMLGPATMIIVGLLSGRLGPLGRLLADLLA